MTRAQRSGLRLRVEKGVHPEVRRACMEFTKWIRTEFEFPIRVTVYLKKAYKIRNQSTNELVSATFFAPYDKRDEPYIRIVTGDYLELEAEWGQDEALASILGSLAHELGHYYQWVDDQELEEEGAEEFCDYVLDLYVQEREHP